MVTENLLDRLIDDSRCLSGSLVNIEQARAWQKLQLTSDAINTFLRLRNELLDGRDISELPASEEEMINDINSTIVDIITGKLTRQQASDKLQCFRSTISNWLAYRLYIKVANS